MSDKPLEEIAKEADKVEEEEDEDASGGIPMFSGKYAIFLVLILILFLVGTHQTFIDKVLRPVDGLVNSSGGLTGRGQIVQGVCFVLGYALLDGAMRSGILA